MVVIQYSQVSVNELERVTIFTMKWLLQVSSTSENQVLVVLSFMDKWMSLQVPELELDLLVLL